VVSLVVGSTIAAIHSFMASYTLVGLAFFVAALLTFLGGGYVVLLQMNEVLRKWRATFSVSISKKQIDCYGSCKSFDSLDKIALIRVIGTDRLNVKLVLMADRGLREYTILSSEYDFYEASEWEDVGQSLSRCANIPFSTFGS
jgi:hypothetical protein